MSVIRIFLNGFSNQKKKKIALKVILSSNPKNIAFGIELKSN